MVKLDETALKTKITELEAKIAEGTFTVPDDIKTKLVDVLNWLVGELTS